MPVHVGVNVSGILCGNAETHPQRLVGTRSGVHYRRGLGGELGLLLLRKNNFSLEMAGFGEF